SVLRTDEQVFSRTALSIDRSFLLRGSSEAEQVRSAAVSPGFFETLGIAPAVGRGLTPEEARPGGPAAVLLADGLWERRFGRDPKVIGQALDLDGRSYTIVGVMPRGFDYPTRTQAWVALELDPETAPMPLRALHSYIFVARLRPGVSLDRAGSAVRRAALQGEEAVTPARGGWGCGPAQVGGGGMGDDGR